jgi:peptide/nickel transport system substrate-binding protein
VSATKNVHQHIGIALLATVSLMTSSCTLRPKNEAATAVTGGGEQSSSLATPVNPSYPGPYKTLLKDGVEYKVGRFPQGTYGGTVVLPQIASDPKTFNPWVAADSTSSELGGLMFPSLVSTDPYNGEIMPELAAEYKVDPDHLTYIVRLRKGLKWSDGKPITADDVEYTYNTIIAKGYGNSSARDVISVEGKPPVVTVVDPLTIKFVTAKPFVPFLRTGLGVSIAPKHVVQPIISSKDGRARFDRLWSQSDTTATKTLVTSGPFVLKRFVPSQRVEFARTKNYYALDPTTQKQLPYLDGLTYLFVPDVNTVLLKFKAKETDVSGVRNKDAVQLVSQQQQLNFKLYNLGAQLGTNFLMFNLNQRKDSKGKPYVEPYKSAWFNDVNFRQAVNHAINRQNIIDGYLKGIGTPSYCDQAQASPFFDKQLQPINQDLSYSESLLQKSGFKKGTDGMLHDKDGHLVEFSILSYAGSTFCDAECNYMQNDLKKLGMKVNYVPLEFNVLQDKISGSKDWEAVAMALTGDPYEPNNGANVYHSNGRMHLFDLRDVHDGTIVATDARPWEKQLDSIFASGAQEFDPVKRKAIYDQYEQILYDQVPFIYTVTPMVLIGARNTVQNYQPTQLSQQAFSGIHNLDEIWIKP